MPGLPAPLAAIISQQPTKSQGMEEDAAWALADLQYPAVAVLVPLLAAVPATVDGWIADRRMLMPAVPTKIAATLVGTAGISIRRSAIHPSTVAGTAANRGTNTATAGYWRSASAQAASSSIPWLLVGCCDMIAAKGAGNPGIAICGSF